MPKLRVALFTRPPLPDWTEAIKSALEERGHSVSVVAEPVSDFDCGWIRVLPDDHFDDAVDYWAAAQASEAAGLPLLNSCQSRLIAADKMAVYNAFVGLKTPPTWLIGEEEGEYPLVCKPLSGSQGRDIAIVESRAEALAHQEEVGRDCLLQEIVDSASCIRVIASPERSLCAYEKRADGQFVLSVAMGAERQPIALGDDLSAMACQMVSAIGADIGGCDILKDQDGQLWALEINASFAFDSSDRAIADFYADQIELSADRSV